MTIGTVGTTSPESDGNSVTIGPLSASVVKGQVAYANAWLGLADRSMDSGEYVALSLRGEYQFNVPSGLSVSAGDIVCVDTTQVTGHTPDSAAYNTNAVSATNLALFKATADKDDNDVVTGILLVLNS